MFKNEYTLTVDLKKKMTAIVPKFVQYDNATLVFKIFDGGKLYDLTNFTRAEVAHKRPDGQVVVGTGIIETLSSGEKIVRYSYLGSEMNKTGYVETSLSIFSSDEKVSILPFKVEIFKDNRDGLIESAKEEVGLLQELIADVSAILDDANTAIDNANNAVTVANQATTDANTAITNANLAITEAQNAANATIQVKDDTLIVKGEAEQATINANNAVTNLVHKGEYNPTASYLARNIVSLDGSSYMNIVPSTGISPTDNTHWKLIGKKGDTGLQGIQGIKGDKGDKGDTGKGFSITKTYPSVAAMYADYNNASIPIGSFVLINTSDINNVENAMLFVKTEVEYSYLTDLSGAQGIQGERGLQGIQGIQGIQGVKGDKGDKGDAGIDGLGFTWRGIYNSIENYNLNDAVYYEGSSFVALKPLTGVTPIDDGINWSMMAQRGVDGTGSVSSVNTKLPNVNGDVTLTPSDIGASPSDHTHSELHTHSNKTVLDGLTDDAGQLKYNGTTVGSVTSVNGQVGDVTGLETVTASDTKLATKVDKVTGKGLSTEDYTTDEKTKLSGIATNANNYTHPANHPPSIITQDANNRFMTDAEKTKLNGIETGAQVNTITSVNGATGIITGLATDTSVDSKIATINNAKIDKTAINQPNGVAGLDEFGDLGTDMIIDKASQQPLSQSVADLRAHITNQEIHVTQTKKNEWDAKATPTYVDNKIGILSDLQTTNKTNLVGAVNEVNSNLINKVNKGDLVINVKDFGAIGNGIVDDTTSIRNAISATPYGGTLYLPAGNYLVSGTGSEIFLINKVINIVGASSTTGFFVKSNVSSTTDVIRVSISGEARFITLEQFMILPQSGNPARYGIHIDVTNPTDKLANMLISRVRIEQLGSKGIKLTNPTGDGFYCSQIEKNLIVGGIELERCGDSVMIHENTISGKGIGIDISSVDGSIEQSISYNNITSDGGSIRVKSGNQMNILYNNIEQINNYDGNSGAMIEVLGTSGNPVIGAKIIGNSLNGNLPTTKPTHLIKVDFAEDTVIENNNLQKGAGASINVTANAKDTKLGANRWGTAEIETSVTDAGVGTRNVWQVPNIVTGWQNNGTPANTVGFSKDRDGYVHLRGAVITTLSPPVNPVTLFTIPNGFRPPKEVWFIVYALNGTDRFPAYIKITSLGAVVLEKGATALYDIISLEGITFASSEV